jgi:hypothetical protein
LARCTSHHAPPISSATSSNVNARPSQRPCRGADGLALESPGRLELDIIESQSQENEKPPAIRPPRKLPARAGRLS